MPASLDRLATGNAFRDRVCALLRAAGFQVTSEIRALHKKIDALASKMERGRLENYAVECKNYSADITKQQSINIIADYLPLIDKRVVDEVWIIARDFSADARSHIENIRGFRAFSIDDLNYLFADFSAYLSSIEELYQKEAIERFYVPTQDLSGHNIEDQIQQWLASDDQTPIAIEAGYGKGKTTFSLQLCKNLINALKTQPLSRIPIYVPLDQIANEQSVSGLISDVLANQPLVTNYSFELIKRLNHEGCLVFIFDGFDEMKHGLSFGQFCYNFSQILTLQGPRSKIIVLGRPTAFLAEDERAFIFLGREKTLQGRDVPHHHWPKFKMLSIADWTKAQAYRFIRSYFPVASLKHNHVEETELINERVNALTGGAYDHLIIRPLHARMLVEIATDKDTDLESFSEDDLYHLFIQRILERETLKPGRDLRIGLAERRKFAADVAWWMWNQTSLRSARVDQIPKELVSKYAYSSMEYGIDELRRELVVGCFVDKNDATAVYFAHHAFQDFLVAEHVISNSFVVNMELSIISEKLDRSINRFISSQITVGQASNFLVKLSNYSGSIKVVLLELASRILRRYRMHNFGIPDPHQNFWIMHVSLMEVVGSSASEYDYGYDRYILHLEELLKEDLGGYDTFAIVALLQFSIWLSGFAAALGHRGRLIELVCRIMMRLVPIGAMVGEFWRSEGAKGSNRRAPAITRIFSQLNCRYDSDRGEDVIIFDSAHCFDLLEQECRRANFRVSDLTIAERTETEISFRKIFADGVISGSREAWVDYLSRVEIRDWVKG